MSGLADKANEGWRIRGTGNYVKENSQGFLLVMYVHPVFIPVIQGTQNRAADPSGRIIMCNEKHPNVYFLIWMFFWYGMSESLVL